MKLERLHVSGYKSIQDIDLTLNDLNVLIGANGAGKSNFISLFKMINQIVDKRLELYVGLAGGPDSLLYFGRKVTTRLAVHLYFGRNEYSFELEPSAGDSLIFRDETVYFLGPGYNKPYGRSLGAGHKESRLTTDITMASYVLSALQSWKVYHFHDTSDSAKVKTTGEIGDNAILRPDASNLAAYLYMLQLTYPQHYSQIVRTIRLVAPFFDDFVLRPSILSPGKIQLEWKQRNSDAYFNAYSLSDGTLRFICLATLLLQPNVPSTILIDEPELGLHPAAITVLANLFESAALRTQLIVSTQSVPLVNQMSPENLIIVDRDDERSTFKRLNPSDIKDWIEDYGLGDLWEKNVLGGRP